MTSDQFSSIACIPIVATILHCVCPQKGQNSQKSPKKWKKSKKNTFLSCASINFFLVPARAPKWRFFNPNMGTGLKTPLLGVHALRKIYTRTRWGRGAAYTTRGQKNTIFILCQVYTPPWGRGGGPNAFFPHIRITKR